MDLYIDTADKFVIKIYLKSQDNILAQAEIPALSKQAEKLLPGIQKLLDGQNIKLKQIKNIYVAREGDSFTALRIGIAIANALAYALAVPVNFIGATNKTRQEKNIKNNNLEIVSPKYHHKPNIS